MKSFSRPFLVCGTRPEAIKLAPLVHEFADAADFQPYLCSTGQHREMLMQTFSIFDLVPDIDLGIMKKNQNLIDVSSAIVESLGRVLARERPDLVVVHGDTNTTAAATLAAYYNRIPVAHIEAGLRTGNLLSPWPEEGNRRVVTALASRHYAPTVIARDNLLAENIAETDIVVTGNTVIDALLSVTRKLATDHDFRERAMNSTGLPRDKRKTILVTGHRRESFGAGFEKICQALSRLAERADVRIVYPMHMNPAVREPVERLLGGKNNVNLIEPLDYVSFVQLMTECHFIITDSGGIQEEAPALGKPVLVMRDTTERPEAVLAGTAKLVGNDPDRIVAEAEDLLDDTNAYAEMSNSVNPYGNGDACKIILEDLRSMSRSNSF